MSIKAWFDPNTTAPFRGNSPLAPNPRVACLVDDAGRRYPAPVEELPGLSRALRPGESSRTTLSFLVPAGAGWPRLFLGDPPGIESLLIGHENSPLHGRIDFSLAPGRAADFQDTRAR